MFLFGKKGQGEIIVTMVIILLILGSFVLLWNIVNMVVRDSSEEIEIEDFLTRFEIASVDVDGLGVDVEVYRASGDEDVKELKFVFYGSGDLSYEDSKSEDIPNEFESFVYEFSLGFVVERVLVVPVFEDGSLGMEVEREV